LGESQLEASQRQGGVSPEGTEPDEVAVAAPASSSDDGGIGEIDEIIGFHIRLAHGAAYRHFTETFADLGLTQKMVSVLWLIEDHPRIAQADIGRRLQMDRATTMAIINRLEARDLLVRGESKQDRRRQTLTLTADGRDALNEARRCIREHEAWVRSRFTKREATLLIELLRRIHE
jgi:DNA-binding MarR family transcriptional regulator